MPDLVLFQNANATEHFLRQGGTLADWKAEVARFCVGNSRLVFPVCVSFGGPCLSILGMEGGGFLSYGASSSGKTTGGIVGGSVLGGGGRTGFVRSFRATGNSLELIAELHNDLSLFVDEIAEHDARETIEVIYFLANGSGKARMSRGIGLRKSFQWRMLFMCFGELTLIEHVAPAGKKPRGGAEIRLLAIPSDAGAGLGVFEELHGAASPAVFADSLKGAALRCYGTPLRAWLRYLANNARSAQGLLRGIRDAFVQAVMPAQASGEVYRAATRFGLVAAAGEVATLAGVTGWEQGEAERAAATCFNAWLASRGTTGGIDNDRGVATVRHFLEAHGSSRFQRFKAEASNQVVNFRAGYRKDLEDDPKDPMFYVFPEVWKSEVCKGFDAAEVARELRRRGLLEAEEGRLTLKPHIPAAGGSRRVFAVRAGILEGEL
jgi:putative DNA primase/helicase